MTQATSDPLDYPSILDILSDEVHYALECLRDAEKALNQLYELDNSLPGSSTGLGALRAICDWFDETAFRTFYDSVGSAQASCASVLSYEPETELPALGRRYAKQRQL